MRKKIELLKNHSYILAHLVDIRVLVGNDITVNGDTAACRFLELVEASEDCRFSRSRRTYETYDLSVIDLKVYSF